MTIRGLRNRLLMLMRGQWRQVYYDLKCRAYHLDLAMETVEAMGLSTERSNWCSNSGGPDLEVVLDSIQVSESDCAIDIGCGKGGAMITLARYPFKRIDGIELSPKAAAIATSNFAKMRVADRCHIRCTDAAAFTELCAYQLIYMYNPFPKVVMEAVLENIAHSLVAHPRQVTFIYKNPVYDDLVRSSGFQLVREFRHSETPFHVYRSVHAKTIVQARTMPGLNAAIGLQRGVLPAPVSDINQLT